MTTTPQTTPISLSPRRRQQLLAEETRERTRLYEAGRAQAARWLATSAKFPAMQRLAALHEDLSNEAGDPDVCIHCQFVAALAGVDHADEDDQIVAASVLGQDNHVDTDFLAGFMGAVSEMVSDLEAEAAGVR